MALFPTNATQVQQFAGALYGVQIGSTTLTQVTSDIQAAGGLNNALNAYYTASFGSSTTASVAASVAANLGLTDAAATAAAAYIAAVLNGTAANARGAAIEGVLNLFSTMTADATFGAAATAWNTKVATAAAYTGSSNVAIGTSIADGGVFSLVAGQDILSPTSTTSASKTTAGNDTIYATADGTLGSTDIVDGGAGTDTILSGQTSNTQTIAPILSNVEVVTLTVTPADTKAFTFNAANSSGITNLNVKDAGAVSMAAHDELITLSGLAKTTTVGIIGGTASTGATSSEITATFTGAAAADTQNVAISTLGKVGVLTLSTAETVNIAATGTGTTGANTIGSLAATAVKTLNITGSGDLTLAASDLAAAVTVNASAATGKISFTGETAATSTTFTGGSGDTTVTTATVGTVAITTGAGADVVNVSGGNSTGTISTGDGNDEVNVGAQANVTAADTIVGGAGTDTITISDATVDAATKTALATGVSGFEILKTSNVAEVTINFNALSSYDVVTVVAGTASAAGAAGTAGAASVAATMESADQLVVAGARTGQNGAVATAAAGVQTSGAGGDGITVTPKLDNGTNIATLKFVGNADISGGAGGAGANQTATEADVGGAGGIALNAANIETLNIEVSGTEALVANVATVTFTGGLGGALGTGGTAGANGSSVVVGTNGTINLTSSLTGATAVVNNNVDLGTVVGTNATVNGAAFLGNITATAASGNVTLIGGAGKDALTGGNGTDVLTGGAGADTLNGMAGADVYTGGAGRDSFAISASGATAGAFDTVADFGKVTTALTAVQVETTSATNAFGTAIAAATTLGGAEADLLIFAATATLGGVQASTDVKAAVTGAVTINATETAKGVLSISGADAASVDTLAEWVAVANIMAGAEGNIVEFEFAGSTYVFQQGGAGADTLVQLIGVTGVTGAVVAGSVVAAAVGDIFVA